MPSLFSGFSLVNGKTYFLTVSCCRLDPIYYNKINSELKSTIGSPWKIRHCSCPNRKASLSTSRYQPSQSIQITRLISSSKWQHPCWVAAIATKDFISTFYMTFIQSTLNDLAMKWVCPQNDDSADLWSAREFNLLYLTLHFIHSKISSVTLGHTGLRVTLSPHPKRCLYMLGCEATKTALCFLERLFIYPKFFGFFSARTYPAFVPLSDNHWEQLNRGYPSASFGVLSGQLCTWIPTTVWCENEATPFLT